MSQTRYPLVVLLSLLTLLPTPAFAYEAFIGRIPNGGVNRCANCHINQPGGGQRNDFGLAFFAAGKTWTADLAALDSDGDSFTNGTELQDPNGEWSPGEDAPGNAGKVTLPGDPGNHPPDDEDPPGDCPAVDIGGACAENEDCGKGGICLDYLQGGYCVVDAGEDCCPQGSVETKFYDETSYCLETCRETSECRDGEEAYQTCDDDEDAGEKICWGCLIPEVEIGTACDGDGDCGENGTCLTDFLGYTWGNGYCAVDWDIYCCPAGSSPVTLENEEGEELSFCLLTCQGDGDCRENDNYLCDNEIDSCWPIDDVAGGDDDEAETGTDGADDDRDPGVDPGEDGGDASAGGDGGGGGGSSKKKSSGCATPGGVGSVASLRTFGALIRR